MQALGPTFYLALVILNVRNQIRNLHLNMSVNCVIYHINRWCVKLVQAVKKGTVLSYAEI